MLSFNLRLPRLVEKGSDSESAFDVVVPIVLARIRRGGPFPDTVPQVLFAIERLSDTADHYLSDDERKEFDQLLRSHQALRRAVWQIRIGAVLSDGAMFHHLSSPKFGDIQEEDIDWLFGFATGRPEHDGRLLYILDRAYDRSPKNVEQHIAPRSTFRPRLSSASNVTKRTSANKSPIEKPWRDSGKPRRSTLARRIRQHWRRGAAELQPVTM